MIEFICLAAVIILLKTRGAPSIIKRKPVPGVPGYRLFYSDQKTAERQDGVIYSELLSSEKWGLRGKPDYIFIRGRDLTPVELKSGSIGDKPMPRLGDLMQLTAYFLILEDVYGIRPKRGRLVYRDYMFIIKNTFRLRRRLVLVLQDMRDMLRTGEQEVSPGFAKCKHCVCRGTVCEFTEAGI